MTCAPIRILGVDPGLRNTGWGIIDAEGARLTFVASGCVRSDPAAPMGARLRQLHEGLCTVIAAHAPQEAAIEETFVNRDPQSALKLGQARGVALTAPALAGLTSTISLEMGIRGGVHPIERRQLGSILSEYLRPTGLVDEDLDLFELDLLDYRRTFLEKLFAIHAAAARHLEGDATALNRQGRHYYDIYYLLGRDDVVAFAGSDDYRTLAIEIDALSRAGGDVLLIGVDQTANAALHLAAQSAGRRQFVRWGLTPGGVVECPSFPGCPNGFNAIEEKLQGVSQTASSGSLHLQRIPLRDLIHTASGWIREVPTAMLCDDTECLLCGAVRKSLQPRR